MKRALCQLVVAMQDLPMSEVLLGTELDQFDSVRVFSSPLELTLLGARRRL